MQRFWLISLACIVLVWTTFEIISASYTIGYVPKKFGLTWPYHEGGCGGFFSYFGAFAVGMDRKTLDDIHRERFEWFADVGPPRSIGRELYFTHWKPTPVPVSTWSEGIPLDLDCARRHSWLWPSAINNELRIPGSYYSIEGNRAAYVLPKLGLIVITPNTD
jgi:hypothetical protein